MLYLPLPFHGLTEFALSLTTITLCHLGEQSEGEIKHPCKQQQKARAQKPLCTLPSKYSIKKSVRVHHFCSVTQRSRTYSVCLPTTRIRFSLHRALVLKS